MGPVVNEVLLPCTHSYCSKCLQVRSACPPASDLIATVLTARYPNLIKLKLNFTCCFCARPESKKKTEHSNTSSIPMCIGTPGSNSASPSAPNRAPHAAHRCPRTNASGGSGSSTQRRRVPEGAWGCLKPKSGDERASGITSNSTNTPRDPFPQLRGSGPSIKLRVLARCFKSHQLDTCKRTPPSFYH